MRTLFLAFILAFVSTAHLQADENTMTPHRVFDLKTVIETSLSPDNNYIAFTLNISQAVNEGAGSDYRELYVYDIRKGEVLPFITGTNRVYSIGWTPDGKAITFRSGRRDLPGMQVYAINLSGGESYPLTRHTASVNSYAFIDEQTLAIVSIEGEDPRQAQLRRMGYEIEVYEEEYRHLNLYRYDLDTHETIQLTKGVTVFDFVISPDGSKAAAAIASKNLVDYSYMFKRIHLVDMQSGKTSLIMENPGKLGKMAWSPDGKRLAFQAASKLEDSVDGSLFVMDVPTSRSFEELRNYVQDMELSVIDVDWIDSNTLIYAAEEGVDIILSSHKLDAAERELVIGPETVVFSSFRINDGMISFAGNTRQHPNELFSFDMENRSLRKLTDHNPWLKDIRLSRQRKLVYHARDGKDIEGVLLYPLNYREGQQYPLITYIHGGPEAAVKNGWVTSYSIWGQVATARDYFVFMPNYRASSGRGVDFTMAGYGDLVGVEYDDVLDGIDHLIAIGYVDPARVGMGGGSYGGYFSAWSATRHTDRFAAAVVFVGISNQISKRNTTDIPWEDYYVHWGYWTHEDHEDVYGRSPIKYAHQSNTPTLVLHGDSDSRVHPSQGLELYRSLKLHGKAPVRLIWYKNEGHGNRLNVHRLDYLVRTMEWFDHYLRLDKPRDEMPPKYPEELIR
jgi:dipeptidyl aminopeptidase/acylaminoacyl peptidase